MRWAVCQLNGTPPGSEITGDCVEMPGANRLSERRRRTPRYRLCSKPKPDLWPRPDPAGADDVASPLSQNLLHHTASHIGQPELPSLEQVSQFLVVNPHQMQNRRLQVVNMHTALGHIEPIVV